MTSKVRHSVFLTNSFDYLVSCFYPFVTHLLLIKPTVKEIQALKDMDGRHFEFMQITQKPHYVCLQALCHDNV